MSEPIVASYTQPTPQLLSLLSSHLPQSLPLLRCLQFTQFPGGITEHGRILYTAAPTPPDAASTDAVFAAAYVDLSRAPETEVWLYSSLERSPALLSAAQTEEAGGCLLALLGAIRELRDEYDASQAVKRTQGPVMFGTLSEPVRLFLLGRGCVFTYSTAWDKWVFRLDGLPDVVGRVEEVMEREGMRWGKVLREDTALVISRSKIPRTEYEPFSFPLFFFFFFSCVLEAIGIRPAPPSGRDRRILN